MSVERAYGYTGTERVVHVDDTGEVVEPFGGYIPPQRLVGALAAATAADRWLTDHPLDNLTGEGDPRPKKGADEETIDTPFARPEVTADKQESAIVTDEDIQELTSEALVHAQ